MSAKFLVLSLVITLHKTNAQSVTCSGDCVCPPSSAGNACVLNCYGSEQCKDSILKCRSGDTCYVNCNGVNACEGNAFIDGSQSTHVSINCIGDNACKGNTVLNCGTKSCSMLCGTGTSCQNTKVNTDHATSFQCVGNCGSVSIPAPFVIPTNEPSSNNPTQKPSFPPSFSPTTSDPTFSPTISPQDTSLIANMTTTFAEELDGKISTDTVLSYKTSMIIIAVLSFGIALVCFAILWLLCAKRKRSQMLSQAKHSISHNIKNEDITKSVLANYGATQLHPLEADNPLNSLQSTVSDIDSSRMIIDGHHDVETNADYTYIDDMLKQAQQRKLAQYTYNSSPFMYGLTAGNLPKIEYRPPISAQMRMHVDNEEFSHATVSTDALSVLQATGDLCCSSDNAEEEGSRSQSLSGSVLSSKEADAHLDAAYIATQIEQQTDVKDDWLVNEINDTNIEQETQEAGYID